MIRQPRDHIGHKKETTAWPDALCLRYLGSDFESRGMIQLPFLSQNGMYRFGES